METIKHCTGKLSHCFGRREAEYRQDAKTGRFGRENFNIEPES